MTNLAKYAKVFMECLGVAENELNDLKYFESDVWDSVSHMNLISTLEETFDVMMDTDDILEFDSYKKGMEILRDKYAVEF